MLHKEIAQSQEQRSSAQFEQFFILTESRLHCQVLVFFIQKGDNQTEEGSNQGDQGDTFA